jgi:hypothetical protein
LNNRNCQEIALLKAKNNAEQEQIRWRMKQDQPRPSLVLDLPYDSEGNFLK